MKEIFQTLWPWNYLASPLGIGYGFDIGFDNFGFSLPHLCSILCKDVVHRFESSLTLSFLFIPRILRKNREERCPDFNKSAMSTQRSIGIEKLDCICFLSHYMKR